LSAAAELLSVVLPELPAAAARGFASALATLAAELAICGELVILC
jgi:hypothetical protein